jgi:hypothetical protein
VDTNLDDNRRVAKARYIAHTIESVDEDVEVCTVDNDVITLGQRRLTKRECVLSFLRRFAIAIQIQEWLPLSPIEK